MSAADHLVSVGNERLKWRVKKPPPNPFRAARKNVGLTQQEVAKLTGLAASIISELETGDNTNPTWNVLGRLCQLYHCRPEELLGWPKLP